LGYFEQHASAALRRPAVQASIRHTIVDGAGHAFFSPSAQQTLQTLLNEFVTAPVERLSLLTTGVWRLPTCVN
jgi:hypothetical protein